MLATYEKLNPDKLLDACGILESTLLNIINDAESKGMDVSEYLDKLNDAHMAVDTLFE